jgi:hypothetical protein
MNKQQWSIGAFLLLSGLALVSLNARAISGVHCTYQNQSPANIKFCNSHPANIGKGSCKVQAVYKTTTDLPGWTYKNGVCKYSRR